MTPRKRICTAQHSHAARTRPMSPTPELPPAGANPRRRSGAYCLDAAEVVKLAPEFEGGSYHDPLTEGWKTRSERMEKKASRKLCSRWGRQAWGQMGCEVGADPLETGHDRLHTRSRALGLFPGSLVAGPIATERDIYSARRISHLADSRSLKTGDSPKIMVIFRKCCAGVHPVDE